MDSPAPSENVNQTSGENDTERTVESGEKEKEKQEEPVGESQANQSPSELPPEIRVKLRRLDKMESRYHGMYDLLSWCHWSC